MRQVKQEPRTSLNDTTPMSVTLLCYRCGWRWMPRKVERPKVGPRCHSTRWYDTKTDEELYRHWLEWAVGMHWWNLFLLAEDAATGVADQARARRLVRSITLKARKRTLGERPKTAPSSTPLREAATS